MFITRKAEFSASHACWVPSLTEEQNQQVYGAASNPRGHGHNYVVEVTLAGVPDPITGMIVDLKEVKDILNRDVVGPFDHRFLNHEVSPFDRVVPTTENVAIEIWRRLEPSFRTGPARLANVRLWETDDLFVDYAGDAENAR
ncbi:MAG: 6-carboxytetrahydropterin synthase [Acidobacteria bacterium]|nr:6-carboxytetrahydropterin synthase [Acidobacteriota bacterium]